MIEILNTTNIDEINESMNFDTERSKALKPSKKKALESLLKKLFKLKLRSSITSKLNVTLATSKSKTNPIKLSEKLFQKERLSNWDEITQIESKDFHKMDRIAKYKLSKIIPFEINKKRLQDLIIPKESAPNNLKRVFQYLAYTVKSDLISECTASNTNYRPLTFPPPFICKARSVSVTDSTNNTSSVATSKKIKNYEVDVNDWHVANLMIFQNLANLLYGVSMEFCNPTACPIMTVGKNFEYMWCDGITFVEPISIPARTYMKFCLLWIQKQLKDSQIIPSTSTSTENVNAIYSDAALVNWKMMYRRLLRVYAHLALNHQADFDKIGILGFVLTCMLRRIVLYGLESGLTNKKELEPIKGMLKKIQREFRLNESYE